MQSINLDGYPRPVVVIAGMDEFTLRDGHVITRDFYRIHASEADAREYARLVASGDIDGAYAHILETVDDYRLTPEQRSIARHNSEQLGGAACDSVRGLSPDECRDYLEMRACVPPGTVPLAWSPSAQAPVCVGPESGRWTLAGREIPPDAVAEVWRAICRDHRVTSDEIAVRIGVHPRTVGWWRVGKMPVHAAHDILTWLASRALGD